MHPCRMGDYGGNAAGPYRTSLDLILSVLPFRSQNTYSAPQLVAVKAANVGVGSKDPSESLYLLVSIRIQCHWMQTISSMRIET